MSTMNINSSNKNASLDDAADVSHSTAFVVIETLVDEGQIAEERSNYLKDKFRELHTRVLNIYKRDNVLLKRARQLRGQLEVERKRVLSKGDVAKVDDAEIQRLKQNLLNAEQELNAAQDRESVLQVEALEYDRQRQSLILERQDAIAAAEARIRPQMEEMERGAKEMGEQVEALMAAQVSLNNEFDLLTKEEQTLQNDAATFAISLTETKQQYVNREHEPERATTQLHLVQRTLTSAEKELDNVNARLAHQTYTLHTLEAQRSLRASDVASVQSTIQRLRNEVSTKQNTLATLRSSLEAEEEVRQGYQDRLQELDRLIKAAHFAARQENDAIDKAELDKQKLMKQYAAAEQERDNVRHECERVEEQIKLISKDKEEQLRHCEGLTREMHALRQTIELRNRKLLIEQRKEAGFLAEANSVMNDVKEVEGLIHDQVTRQEMRRAEILNLAARRQELNTERVREAGRLAMVQNELRMKAQQLSEQVKREAKLRRCYSEMREELHNVKRDRSFKATQIQTLTQKMTEVAEKTSILERELEALMSELELKEKEVISHKRMAQNVNNTCLHLWEEKNKLRKKYSSVVSSCKEMKAQLARLTGNVADMESEMTNLQSSYTEAIERRNQNGIELIDRNDEMTLLTEKVKTQKRAIDEGAELRAGKEDIIWSLRRQLAEVRREIDMCQRALPKLHAVEDEIEVLTADINDEQWRVATLERDLTDPRNTARWNRLKVIIDISSSSSCYSSNNYLSSNTSIMLVTDGHDTRNTSKKRDEHRSTKSSKSDETKLEKVGKVQETSIVRNNKNDNMSVESTAGIAKSTVAANEATQNDEHNSNHDMAKVNNNQFSSNSSTTAIRSNASNAQNADHELERLSRPSTAAPPPPPPLPAAEVELSPPIDAFNNAGTTNNTGSISNNTNSNQCQPNGEIFGEDEEVAEAQVRLQARCQELEARLNNIEERISEKELILQEVRELSERIGQEAVSGRECTIALARQINLYQSNIRQRSRQMMSTISELSLCQASSLQLEQEVEQLEKIVSEAETRLEAGLVPFAEAEEEYIRAKESNNRYEQMLRESNEINSDNVLYSSNNENTISTTATVMTTAIPRATAYVPDDALGLPVPFSHFAPFRPSEPLTTRSCGVSGINTSTSDNYDNNKNNNSKPKESTSSENRQGGTIARRRVVMPAAMPWSAKNVQSNQIIGSINGNEASAIVASKLASSIPLPRVTESINTSVQRSIGHSTNNNTDSISDKRGKRHEASTMEIKRTHGASSARVCNKHINASTCSEQEALSSAIPRASSTELSQNTIAMAEEKRIAEVHDQMSSTQ